MDPSQFESWIREALDALPPKFAEALDNVEVTWELWPTDQDLRDGHVPECTTLFGLYRGIPKTKRANYTNVLPDRIIIFAGPILSAHGADPALVKRHVQDTVLHELGHYFGLNDEEIRRAGK